MSTNSSVIGTGLPVTGPVIETDLPVIPCPEFTAHLWITPETVTANDSTMTGENRAPVIGFFVDIPQFLLSLVTGDSKNTNTPLGGRNKALCPLNTYRRYLIFFTCHLSLREGR